MWWKLSAGFFSSYLESFGSVQIFSQAEEFGIFFVFHLLLQYFLQQQMAAKSRAPLILIAFD